MNFAGTKIAQHMIHLRQRVGQIAAFRPIGGTQLFAGMQIIQSQEADIAHGGQGGGKRCRKTVAPAPARKWRRAIKDMRSSLGIPGPFNRPGFGRQCLTSAAAYGIGRQAYGMAGVEHALVPAINVGAELHRPAFVRKGRPVEKIYRQLLGKRQISGVPRVDRVADFLHGAEI